MNVQPNPSERRQRVAELTAQRLSVPDIHRQLIVEGIVNPQTAKPYSRTTVRADVTSAATALPARVPGPDGRGAIAVGEMIGRVDYSYPYRRNRSAYMVSVDRTLPDYVAWDKLRRCKLKGFEIGGLFCQPIVEIVTAFELGSGFTLNLEAEADDDTDASSDVSELIASADDATASVPAPPVMTQAEKDQAYTERLLNRLVKRILAVLMTTAEDAKALGDQYIVVNPDGSLSVPSPNTVYMDTDPLDYRKIVRVTIKTVLDHATITDEYTEETRTVRILWMSNGQTMASGHPPAEPVTSTAVFPNLIGRIPVIHIANDRSSNELFGRPIYEALFRIFSRYDDLIEKGLDGVELMGNPIPVFTGVDDVNAFLKANGVTQQESYYDANGNSTSRTVLEMDKLPAIIVGKGGDAKMVAPARGMTEDIGAALQMLFNLICVHSRIPFSIWGHYSQEQGLQGGDPQIPPFLQYILSRRLQLLGEGTDDLLGATAQDGIYGLIDIWLRIKRLTDPRIVVGSVKATFPELTPEDANTLLQKVIYANGAGLMRGQTSLDKLRLVSDPVKEYELAQAEMQAQMQAQIAQQTQTAINTVAHKQQDLRQQQPPTTVTDGKPPLPAGGRRDALKDGTRVGEQTSGRGKRRPRGGSADEPTDKAA